IFVLHAMTYSPYEVWRETGHISPTRRGNLFRAPRSQAALDLDAGRFAAESGFIIVLFGAVTLALSAKPRHGDDAKT
ncbi:MAG: hypothetical protein KKI02_07265, partial [Planctomycetes bacterium]|nr:hypothetical protein [Planctomycetota bacterium]